MSRAVTSTFKSASYAQENQDVYLVLLDIEQSAIGTIQIVNNTSDVVFGGTTYTAFGFNFQLPDDSDERIPSAQLSIDNVDRQMVEAVRAMTGPATVTIRVIANSDKSLQAGPYVMTLRDVGYDAGIISGRLDVEDMLNEPFPSDLFTPTMFPGLF